MFPGLLDVQIFKKNAGYENVLKFDIRAIMKAYNGVQEKGGHDIIGGIYRDGPRVMPSKKQQTLGCWKTFRLRHHVS